MPVLYEYVNHNGYYIRTHINGEVATFQVTFPGAEKLRTIGIRPGDKFPRPILIRLWLDGDAYTGQAGPHEPPDDREKQVEFDFAEDMIDGGAFPVCDCCSSLEKLGLVMVSMPGKILKGELACEKCFSAFGLSTDIQTRLYIRTENNLQITLLLSKMDTKTPNAAKLEILLQGLIVSR